jgi:hypothetical protein
MNSRIRFLGALLLATPFLVSCDGDGGVDLDRNAPSVTATTPTAGATDVDRNTTITATFSEAIAGASVTTATFTVTPAGGAAIAGAVSTGASTATFTPASPLAFGTTYTARLTTGVTDLAGNGLLQAHSWTFTTLANPAPAVVGTTPTAGATNVARNTAITVTFSEPVAPATVTATTFQVAPAQGAAITGTLLVNGATVTFTPAAPLLFDTTYNVVLTTGITDVDGAPLAAAHTWSFRTLSNAAPAANAGPAQDVNRGEQVTLSGSATDPEGHTVTYRWTQVFGPDVTGGPGFLTGQSPTFTAPATVSSVRFELRVTDQFGKESQASVVQINVMEDKTRAIFVSPLGDDNNSGARNAPVRTIVRGLGLATTMGGGTDVYVANGTYNELLGLQTGVSIYGGYQSATWLRDPVANQVTVNGGNNMITILGVNVSDVTLDGLRLTTPTEALATGLSVHTVFLRQAQNITITNNHITAGDALAGSGGQFGFNGVQGLPGAPGTNATCPALTGGAGGAAGQPGAPSAGSQIGVAGGSAGDGGDQNVSGEAGTKGNDAGATTGGAGGPGGTVGTPAGGDGTTGTTGAAGQNGTGGGQLGTLSTAGYVPADGTNGTSGTSGSGGGGGGGGSGTATGAGGGGGGGGGSGGGGNFGQGGKGGPGSFAVVAMSSTGIVIDRNTITTGKGGVGGLGGPGGNGRPGGLGGIGGGGCNGGGNGGRGANGGAGGDGGHGGGGGGGPSIGILKDAGSTVTIGANNTYQIGSPGAGGFSQGAQGAGGVAGNTHTMP